MILSACTGTQICACHRSHSEKWLKTTKLDTFHCLILHDGVENPETFENYILE